MTLTNDAAAAVAPLDPAVVHAGIEALLPRIAEGAAAADRNRRVDDEAARPACDAGAHRFLQPAAYGGAESSVVDHVRAVARVAEGCAAAGWCLAVWSVHNWMLAHYDAATQAEVWGADPTAVISGSIVPKTPFPDDGDGQCPRPRALSGSPPAATTPTGCWWVGWWRDGRPTPCQTIGGLLGPPASITTAGR
ncbi:MAG: acyl-CoA dehydrogenase family protein [Acidimicrobiales bacterium]